MANSASDINRLIGAQLARLRTAKGMTQREFAKLCTPESSAQQISKFELGINRISCPQLCDFASVLGCSLSELIDVIDLPESEETHAGRGDIWLMRHYRKLAPHQQASIRALVGSMAEEAGA